MKTNSFFAFSLLLFIMITSLTSCSHSDVNSKAELYKDLVEKLVEDPNKDQQYIYQASLELRAAGKDAWPILFQHLNDQRPSDAFAAVMQPHDVSHAVYYTLLNQVNCMPPGYYRSKVRKISEGKSTSYSGRYLDIDQSKIKEWLEQRSHLSLNEIKLQSAMWTLKKENEAGYPDEKEKNRIQKVLKKEISRLEKLAKREKAGLKEPKLTPELQDILNTKIIPKIFFKNEQFEEAIHFLQNILIQKGFYFINFGNSFTKNTFSLKIDNHTVKEFLDEVCKQTGVTYKLGKRVILFNYNSSGK